MRLLGTTLAVKGILLCYSAAQSGTQESLESKPAQPETGVVGVCRRGAVAYHEEPGVAGDLELDAPAALAWYAAHPGGEDTGLGVLANLAPGRLGHVQVHLVAVAPATLRAVGAVVGHSDHCPSSGSAPFGADAHDLVARAAGLAVVPDSFRGCGCLVAIPSHVHIPVPARQGDQRDERGIAINPVTLL